MSSSTTVHHGEFGGIGKIFSALYGRIFEWPVLRKPFAVGEAPRHADQQNNMAVALKACAESIDSQEVERAQAQYAASHEKCDEMIELMLGQLRETLDDFGLEGDDATEVVRNFSSRVNSLISE